jgi:hypothetical protein
LWYKRLEAGTFEVLFGDEGQTSVQLYTTELAISSFASVAFDDGRERGEHICYGKSLDRCIAVVLVLRGNPARHGWIVVPDCRQSVLVAKLGVDVLAKRLRNGRFSWSSFSAIGPIAVCAETKVTLAA